MVRCAIVLAVLAGCGFQPAVVDGNAGGEQGGDDGDVVPRDAPIPITIVQMGMSTAGGTHMSDSVNLTMSQNAGDLIVVAVSWGGGMTTATCADSAGNTYQALSQVFAHDGVGHVVFYAENIHAKTADTVTVTLGSNQNNIALRVLEYSGIATSGALDQKALAVGMSGTATSPDVTTTHAHELIYAASTNTNTADAPGPGYAERINYGGDICEDREVTATGTYQATIDEGAPEQWTITIATFRAAS